MAWRPNGEFIRGELDNRTRGKVTGWLEFHQLGRVEMDLNGDFHEDIAGCLVRLKGKDKPERLHYLDDFAKKQTGKVGDMTAGLPPAPYVGYPYFEWYGVGNGRVVIELEPGAVEIADGPWWRPGDEHTEKVQGQSAAGFTSFCSGLVKKTGAAVINPMAAARPKKKGGHQN